MLLNAAHCATTEPSGHHHRHVLIMSNSLQSLLLLYPPCMSACKHDLQQIHRLSCFGAVRSMTSLWCRLVITSCTHLCCRQWPPAQLRSAPLLSRSGGSWLARYSLSTSESTLSVRSHKNECLLHAPHCFRLSLSNSSCVKCWWCCAACLSM